MLPPKLIPFEIPVLSYPEATKLGEAELGAVFTRIVTALWSDMAEWLPPGFPAAGAALDREAMLEAIYQHHHWFCPAI